MTAAARRLSALLVFLGLAGAAQAQDIRSWMDLPGGDYANFTVGEPEECRDRCMADAACQAWTYVYPGFQGMQAQCWLKSSVPAAVTSDCCMSGTRLASGPAAGATAPEVGVDRPGGDYRQLSRIDGAEACQEMCAGDDACRAWTYVEPGIQGPSAQCWLKSSVPAAAANFCCTSGVK